MLAIDGGRVKVKLQMTDSARTAWNPDLDEAERTRTHKPRSAWSAARTSCTATGCRATGPGGLCWLSIQNRMIRTCSVRSYSSCGSARCPRRLGRTAARSRPRRRRSPKRSPCWVGSAASRPRPVRSRRAPPRSTANPTRWRRTWARLLSQAPSCWPARPSSVPLTKALDGSTMRGDRFALAVQREWRSGRLTPDGQSLSVGVVLGQSRGGVSGARCRVHRRARCLMRW